MAIPTVVLSAFRRLVKKNKKGLRYFLSRLEKKGPSDLPLLTLEANEMAWAKTDCLDCANCCKTMSPTYTGKDIARISSHLGMTRQAFKDKWLYKDRTGDWMNKKQPCQFLDLRTNLCSIYEARPRDCAGFPHHGTKKIKEYGHMYKQNVEFCPATYRLVENLKTGLANGKWQMKK